MAEWTKEDYAGDVAYNGERYTDMGDADAVNIRGGIGYRTGEYGEKHSVHILYPRAEQANGAGQTLREYGLYGDNTQDMGIVEWRGTRFTEIRLRPVFGVSALLARAGIPVAENQHEALAMLQERPSPRLL